MELPIVQYRRYCIPYSVAAGFAFLIAYLGYDWLPRGGVLSFFGWIFLPTGLIVFGRCSWIVIRNSLVLELNHEGIKYKWYCYGWDTLRSYAIRKEESADSSSIYLVLSFNDGGYPLEIQLTWLANNETVPKQMEAYAKAFQVSFDGVVERKI